MNCPEILAPHKCGFSSSSNLFLPKSHDLNGRQRKERKATQGSARLKPYISIDPHYIRCLSAFLSAFPLSLTPKRIIFNTNSLYPAHRGAKWVDQAKWGFNNNKAPVKLTSPFHQPVRTRCRFEIYIYLYLFLYFASPLLFVYSV